MVFRIKYLKNEIIVNSAPKEQEQEDVTISALPAACSPLLYDDLEQSSDDDEMNSESQYTFNQFCIYS